MKHIVKRAGHSEEYDQRKLYASIFAACNAVRVPAGEAELVAERVVVDVEKWLEPKSEVTSNDIHRVAAQNFKVYNPDAAWIYEHHRNIS